MMIKYLLLSLVLLISVALAILLRPMVHEGTNTSLPQTQVHINGTTVAVEVASTDAAREQGLSDRGSLADGHGMLFVFQQPGHYGFWMKDMNFSLDMLFADASGTILTIDSNVSPAGYHQTPPQVLYGNGQVSYVLELPAGFAQAHELSEGMHMDIVQ